MITKFLAGAALLLAAIGPVAAPAAAQDAAMSGRGAKMWQKFQSKFEAANTSHDGHLTLDQAQAGNMPVVARNFSTIDADHKGYVTLQDVGQFMMSKRSGQQAN